MNEYKTKLAIAGERDVEAALGRASIAFKKYGDVAHGESRKIDAAVGGITRSFAGLGAAAAGVSFAGMAAGLAVASVRALKMADDLAELSERIGVGVEALQEFQHAARQTGADTAQLETGLRNLSRRMAEAADGNGEATKLFQDLGFSATTSAGAVRTVEDVLGDFAEKIKATTNPAERLRLAVEAFGKSGSTLVPMLADGRAGLAKFADEARRLGIVLETPLVEAAGKAKDSLDKLSAVMSTNIARAVASASPLIDAFSEQLAELGQTWAELLKRFVIPEGLLGSEDLSSRLAEAREELRGYQRELRGFEATAGGSIGPSEEMTRKGHLAAIAVAQQRVQQLESLLRSRLRDETKPARDRIAADAASALEAAGRPGYESFLSTSERLRELAWEERQKAHGEALRSTASRLFEDTDIDSERLAQFAIDSDDIAARVQEATEPLRIMSDRLRDVAEESARAGDAFRQVEAAIDDVDPTAAKLAGRAIAMDETSHELTGELQRLAVMSQLMGQRFDEADARASALRSALEQMARTSGGQVTPEMERLAAELRGLEATRELKDMFQDVFGSAAGAFEKMATGVIQGTLDIGDAFRTLGQSIIVEFSQRVIRQALNPLTDELAKLAAQLVTGGVSGAIPSGGIGSSVSFASLGSLAALAGVAGTGFTAYGSITNNPHASAIGGAGSLAFGAGRLYSAVTPSLSDMIKGGFSAGDMASGLGSMSGIAGGLGVGGGVLSLIGASQNNRPLMSAGALLSVGGTAMGLAAAVPAAVAAGGVGASIGGAAAAAGGLGTAAGASAAAMAAAPYVAAAVLAAMSIYSSFETSQNWENLSEGQRTGTRIGALMSPGNLALGGLGFLLPEQYQSFVDPIGGYIGGLLGSFFGKPDIPHDVREQMELGKKLSPAANAFMSSIGGARNYDELYKTLLANQTGYVGGTSAVAFNVGFEASDKGLGYNYLGLYNPPGGDALSQSEFYAQARTRPDDFLAMIQAGVTPSKLDPINQAVKASILQKIEALDELQVSIVKAVNELTKETIAPLDFPAALTQTAGAFRETLASLRESTDEQLDVMRDRLLGMTDPGMILAQTGSIRQALEERYNGEIALVERWSDTMHRVAGAWRDVSAAAEEQIAALALSTAGPTNPSDALGTARLRFREAVEAFRAGESPELAGRVMGLVQPYLVAGEQMYARPSSEYQAIYQEAVGALQEIRGHATTVENQITAAITSALADVGGSLTALREENSAALREHLGGLRADVAAVFTALGFTVPGGNLTDALRETIAAERLSTAAALADLTEIAKNTPADQLSLLEQIAQNTGILAGRVAPAGTGEPGDESWKVVGGGGSFSEGFATGLARVPYDNFMARLHAGEMVLPASIASLFRGDGDAFSLPAPEMPSFSLAAAGARAGAGAVGDDHQGRGGDVTFVANITINGTDSPEQIQRVVRTELHNFSRSLRGGRHRYMLGLDQ